MARPRRLTRDESRRQTRERLLAAASDAFAELGVNGASVEEIAERAGYSRGAFYGNFEDKNELLSALLQQRTLRELDEVRALSQASSFKEVLARLRDWNKARGEHLESWFALRLELILHALRHPEFRPVLGEREQIARRAIADGVEHELRAAGRQPPAELAFLALLVHALEDGLLIQRLLTPEGIADEVVVDAVELLMRCWSAMGRDDQARGKPGCAESNATRAACTDG